VSGGADSVCMLHILLELSKEHNFTVCAAHFNHMLRGEEADRDEAFVKELCTSLGVPFYAGRGNVAAFAKEHGKSTEESARIMRYNFLHKTAAETGAAKIATAHNTDDNAETVILNLARGTGLAGLRGIPPVRDNIIRPILCLTREDVENYLASKSISYVTDSSNLEDVYSRNKLRHRAMPVLRELNPRFAESIMRTGEIIRQDEEYLSAESDRIIAENAKDNRISSSLLLKLPKSLSSRIIRKMANSGLSASLVDDVLNLCKSNSPSAQLDIPGITVRREYDELVFGDPDATTFQETTLILGESIKIPDLQLEISLEETVYTPNIHKSFTEYLFKTADVYGKITIRPRKIGDKLKLRGTRCTKTLKKLFTEKHIPAIYREIQPVIADEMGVLGVYALGCDTRGEPRIGDTIYKIKFKEMPHK
ncbi:MAG: tRNA lysidine(34) synthetase TilS, partial [Oscillospiraceae bacterium]|nr:tRNA lysidine(34) synthetase TilS [Oscillospiraceae bacterium]